MRTGFPLAAALALGAALLCAPVDGAGQTPPPPPPPPAQAAAAPAPSAFSAEQLEQLVAPIALYPDSLLTQTLMASTYPLEIVEASRWLKKNPSLKDAALTEALKGQDWDPSVKSICAFPEVLKKMDENLDWTQDLGDAFLGQQEALLKTVQKMRGKAYESGNLKTTEQQKVTQSSETVIIIEPAQPEVVYVPTYSPTVVYGGWGYPSYYYPSYYAPYPPGAGLVSFGVGMAVGAAVWGNCDWGHNDVDIDVDRYNNFNRNTSVNAERYNRSGSGSANWEHNAEHRRGVNYQNTQTAQKYGGASGSKNVTRDQARGKQPGQGQGGGGREPGTRPSGGGERPTTLPSGGSREPGARPSGGGERPTTLPSGGGADRPSAGNGDRQSGAGASAGTRDVQKPSGSGASQRPSTSTSNRSASKPSGGSAYSGSNKPKADAAASSRGSSSRGTSSYSGSKSSGASRPSSSSSASRPSGGGSRPSGGGGSRGGGGGRR